MSAWARKDLLASCSLLVNAQTTAPFPPPTMQITATHAKEILKMADELAAVPVSVTADQEKCGCAYEVMPGGVHPERRYFHEPDCPRG